MTATVVPANEAGSPDPNQRETHRRRLPVVAVLVAGALSFAGWKLLAGDPATAAPRSAGMPTSPQIEDQYGVRLLGAYVTAAGGMVEIQYQIIDPTRSEAIHTDEVSPVIVTSGVVFDAPGLIGHGHSKETPVAGRTGYVLLANLGNRLHRGDVVSIRVGEVTMQGVTLG